LIELRGVSKSYKKQRALDNFTYTFGSGKVTTIVGPNGSGKTTLMKCLLGFVFPDSGEIRVNGESVLRRTAYRKNIGYMAQKPSFPENLRVREILELVKSLREPDGKYDETLINEFAYAHEFEKPFHSLSGGNKQKLNALIAFLFSPDIILLDEPTAGLDPLAGKILKDKIVAERAKGKTILLTSHILDEIEELTDDLIMLSEGKPRFSFSREALQAEGKEEKLSRRIAELFRDAK
jgi:Cu-processing system ATP-binding protein